MNTTEVAERTDRRLPPVAEVAVCTMALVVIGGVYLAAHLPRRPPLTLPVTTLVVAWALTLMNVANLARLRTFAWDRFFLVGRWVLVGYIVIAGMLEYVFVLDGTRGSVLVVLTAFLLLFAVDVPLLLAFSVARYQTPSPRGDG